MKASPDHCAMYKRNGLQQLRSALLFLICLLYIVVSWPFVSSHAMTPDRKKGARKDQNRIEARGVVDRIEGTNGVVYMGEEEDEKIDVPIKYLPAKVKQGVVLKITIEIDREATQDLRKSIQRLQRRLEDQ